MKALAYLMIPLSFAAAQARAEQVLPLIEDQDQSGDYSPQELQVHWPELTPEGFAALDLDASGGVTLEELQTAFDNGLLKAPPENIAH